MLQRIFPAACVLAAVIAAAPVLAADDTGAPDSSDRIFGVVPNYNTVEPSTTHVRALTVEDKFKLASLSSFDPYVFPIVGMMTEFNVLGDHEDYRVAYGRAMADNAIGNFMTTGVLPSVLHQDPRYYALGRGSVLHRMAYAASRSVVTRSNTGHLQFNASEILGNGAAAGLSNLYYNAEDRTMTGTLGRWGSQVMWDTVANEMKEFWPDIRQKLHRH